jgi:hypothetical protein
MEADEGPIGGQLVRLERAARMVADHQRHSVTPQNGVDVIGEPARMTELEAVPTGRQSFHSSREALIITVKVLRQLPEHRAELARLDKGVDPLVEALDPGVHVGESLHMGQVPTRLDREQEVGWGALGPAFDRRPVRQAIEGVVDLDGAEEARVVL